MRNHRARLKALLERGLHDLSGGASPAALADLLSDALEVCRALEREKPDHTEWVLSARARGLTFRAIGQQIGLSVERTRQLALVGELRRRGRVASDAEGPITADSSIERLELPVAAFRALDNAEIVTVGHLASQEDHRLLRLRGFGRTFLRVVRSELARHGFRTANEGDGFLGAAQSRRADATSRSRQ